MKFLRLLDLRLKNSGFGTDSIGSYNNRRGLRTIGAVDSAKRTLDVPARIGLPANIKGIIDEIGDPSLQQSLVFVHMGATLEPSSGLPFGISVPQIPNLKVNKIVSKVLDLIKSFIPLIWACLTQILPSFPASNAMRSICRQVSTIRTLFFGRF